MSKKLFDFLIGNPPYMETRETTKDMPVYDLFMDASYDVADKVELITPGRFLFNAGATSKAWNQKCLNDPHFKVLKYWQNSSNVFHNTLINGGIAITYRDESCDYGPIHIFTVYEELNSIFKKVSKGTDYRSLNTIMYPYSTYNLSDALFDEHPEVMNVLSNAKIVTTNIFDLLSDLFYESAPSNNEEYCCILGRQNNKHCYKNILLKYISTGENYNKHKVVLSATNGASGALGDTPARMLTVPYVVGPGIAYTQTFLGIGAFDSKDEAEAAAKYIKGKFARALLGVLKITQHNPPAKWEYVPLQDFSKSSDIDWSKSIHDIDLQLYRKYNLDEAEISFIESHVKEMV